MPVGKVVGEFEVKEVHVDKPSVIWKMTKKHAGIDKNFFDEYYRDRKNAVAIEVKSVRKYNTPISLNDLGSGIKAPQSFRYLDNEPERQLLLPI
jgi:predicted transcriptional regulator